MSHDISIHQKCWHFLAPEIFGCINRWYPHPMRCCFNSKFMTIGLVKESVLNNNPPVLTLFRMGFFGAAHGWGGKKPPRLIPVAHILKWWNLAQLYLTKRRSENYMDHVTHPFSFADFNIFLPEISKFCYIKKYRYRFHSDT